MYILIIAIIIIIYIISTYRHHEHGTYCNKYGLCVQLNYDSLIEFESVKTQLLNFYLRLVHVMPVNDPRTMRLRKNFNINTVFEVYPNNEEGDTSYSINKGEEIGVCVRSGQDFYKVHNLNIIKFVFIHELAHLISVSQQHTDEFWQNFRYLLRKCYSHDLLKKIDYSKRPEEYCSMQVNYNPYFDDNIREI